MHYRNLGKSPLQVSALCLGTMMFADQTEHAEARNIVAHAREHGVNFIDTAAGYGNGKSERIIAEVLKTRSEKVWVATKTPPLPGHWPPSPYCDMDERYPENTCAKMLRNGCATCKRTAWMCCNCIPGHGPGIAIHARLRCCASCKRRAKSAPLAFRRRNTIKTR